MAKTPKEMLFLLLHNGFVIVNQKGSHIKVRNNKTKKSTVIPMHCKDLKIGLE